MKNFDNTSSSIIDDSEIQLEQMIRPLNFSQFQGQEDIKKQLNIYINSAKERNDTLDHILFSGPPGLGKTSLAFIVSQELGVSFRSISAPAIEKPAKMASILTNLSNKEILFIDEIHRLNATIEEILYSAMEDFILDLVVGDGPSAQTIKLNLPKFTLIGATTKAGLLSNPLRDRFGILQKLELYNVEDLVLIIKQNSVKLGFNIDDEAAFLLAKRTRGTPRIANRLLRRARDVTQYMGKDKIDLDVVNKTLSLVKIDSQGLDSQDRRLLSALIHTFKEKPVSLASLAAYMCEEKGTISDVIEPYLIQIGFLQRTPQGRIVTQKAIHFLKNNEYNELF